MGKENERVYTLHCNTRSYFCAFFAALFISQKMQQHSTVVLEKNNNKEITMHTPMIPCKNKDIRVSALMPYYFISPHVLPIILTAFAPLSIRMQECTAKLKY